MTLLILSIGLAMAYTVGYSLFAVNPPDHDD
jgi:hypothetical protein